MSAWMFANGAFLGILGISLAEMFPIRLRYSGISLAYQAAGILGGGLAPLVATSLVAGSHGDTWPLATYLVIAAAISWLAFYFGSRRIVREEPAGLLTALPSGNQAP
jgi:MHS family shikimate/dehydroshikimate transporter-like MFS transporter